MRRSASSLPGETACGQKESGWLRDATRGASMAACKSIPKTVVLRKTWSIARGRHLWPRSILDELLPYRRVRLREQPIGRHLHEVRITVVRVTVGERELDRFDDPVQVRRRIVAERFEVDAVEEVQHLQERRPLAPEAARRDLVASKRGPERGPDLDAELGKA